jgi:hypothetical protein
MSSYLRDTTLVSEKAVASHSDIQPLDLSPERVQSNANAIASAWECGFGIALDFFTWKESENWFLELFPKRPGSGGSNHAGPQRK